MTAVTLQFADDVYSALRRSPEESARKLRVAAAIHRYQRGERSTTPRREKRPLPQLSIPSVRRAQQSAYPDHAAPNSLRGRVLAEERARSGARRIPE
jgi:hypothetical protein